MILEYQNNPDSTQHNIDLFNKDIDEKIYPLREKAQQLQQQY